jgi:hypothetical protein
MNVLELQMANFYFFYSGDTMFASGEELYNRLSPSFAAYLETLEAVHSGETFILEVQRNGGGLWEGERGSPFNKNQDLTAVHPIVRTSKRHSCHCCSI